MKQTFTVQTVNGNPEIICVVNGIARYIVREFESIETAIKVCGWLNAENVLYS